MNLPVQAPPITRDPRLCAAGQPPSTDGVTASQSVCDHLTGLAQQMCIATEYGVSN